MRVAYRVLFLKKKRDLWVLVLLAAAMEVNESPNCSRKGATVIKGPSGGGWWWPPQLNAPRARQSTFQGTVRLRCLGSLSPERGANLILPLRVWRRLVEDHSQKAVIFPGCQRASWESRGPDASDRSPAKLALTSSSHLSSILFLLLSEAPLEDL